MEDKILALVNEELSLQPPLQLDDIEVAHRLPHPRAVQEKQKLLLQQQQQAATSPGPQGQAPDDADGSDTEAQQPAQATIPPKPVIIKFTSCRTKARVMGVKNELKNIDIKTHLLYSDPIFFQDDLTSRRAKLAYLARNLRNQKKIAETWIWDSKVLIKDNRSRIHNIKNAKELKQYE